MLHLKILVQTTEHFIKKSSSAASLAAVMDCPVAAVSLSLDRFVTTRNPFEDNAETIAFKECLSGQCRYLKSSANLQIDLQYLQDSFHPSFKTYSY